jgi:hypothetical protein
MGHGCRTAFLELYEDDPKFAAGISAKPHAVLLPLFYSLIIKSGGILGLVEFRVFAELVTLDLLSQ